MNRRTALIFYVLSVYVVVQFVWWGYHLIELTSQINDSSDLVSKRVVMIIGEVHLSDYGLFCLQYQSNLVAIHQCME